MSQHVINITPSHALHDVAHHNPDSFLFFVFATVFLKNLNTIIEYYGTTGLQTTPLKIKLRLVRWLGGPHHHNATCRLFSRSQPPTFLARPPLAPLLHSHTLESLVVCPAGRGLQLSRMHAAAAPPRPLPQVADAVLHASDVDN
jgi:hypothetical protein